MSRPTPEVSSRASDALWGAKVIARFIGASEQTIYSLSREPDCPIFRPSGRYFARKSELERWLLTKPPKREKPVANDDQPGLF